MKKIISIGLVCVLLAGVLTACGKKLDVERSTVYVQKNGSITEVAIEDFKDENYSEEELKDFIDKKVEAYQEEHDKKSAKVSDFSVEEGIAKLHIEYAGYEDYQELVNATLFSGTVPQALAAGYNFDMEFTEVKDGKASGKAESKDITGSEYKVVILSEKIDVKVDGTVKYISSDYTAMKSKDTVSIQLPEEAENGAELSLVYIIYE